MRVLDSRRLTGPSLLLQQPGAIIDLALEGLDPDAVATAWRAALGRLMQWVGWTSPRIVTRSYTGGMSLAFEAPIDVLYAATELNEAAIAAAARALGQLPLVIEDMPTDETFEMAAERLAKVIKLERKPWLPALAVAAAERNVTLLSDDTTVSIGLGRGSRAWPIDKAQAATRLVPWGSMYDIRTALVTGTNGKTTSVRLLGAIAQAAGQVAGVSSTDAISVDGEIIEKGDFSGPNGARTVLRDRRVQVAMLEVARGGILRRGLAVPRAQAALVTNVAADHLGEYGVLDLATMASVKLVVARAVVMGGRVVLNADDPLLLERGPKLASQVTWFTLDPAHAVLGEHLARGHEAVYLEGDALVFARGGERRAIARIDEVPLLMGGAARHNIANALGVIGVAMALNLPEEAIRRGLMAFDNSLASNPGRANVWALGGGTVIVDYAHNPHGLSALAEMTKAMPAQRRAIVIGQAGDRDDEAIREFARTAWSTGPARVFIKEMESFLRGREPGVVPGLLQSELLALGADPASLSLHPTELDATRAALQWMREGDLVLLTTHAQRDEVVALIERLKEADWAAGQWLGGA